MITVWACNRFNGKAVRVQVYLVPATFLNVWRVRQVLPKGNLISIDGGR